MAVLHNEMNDRIDTSHDILGLLLLQDLLVTLMTSRGLGLVLVH